MNVQFFHPHPLFVLLSNTFKEAAQGQDAAYLSILGAVSVCGFIYAFFGYRVYKWVLVLSGVLLGLVLTSHIIDLVQIPPSNRTQVQVVLGVILSIVGGIAAPRLFHLFTFALGGGSLVLAIGPLVKVVPPTYSWLVLVVGFAAGGVFAFLLMRTTLIVATSIAGSYILCTALFALGVRFEIIMDNFNFLMFYAVWFLLGLFAISSQLQQKDTNPIGAIG